MRRTPWPLWSLLLLAPGPAAATSWLQVAPLSQVDHNNVPGELLLRLDGAAVGLVPALLALTPAPPSDPHVLELARADGAYAFRLELAVQDDVRLLRAETLACPQVRIRPTLTTTKGRAQLRLAFSRRPGPPCEGDNGRSPASEQRYKVRFAGSAPSAVVYYPRARSLLDRLLSRQVYDFERQGPAPINLVVPYEPQEVSVIFKAPDLPDCVVRLHMEGPQHSAVTLVAGAQRLPAVPAAAPEPPPLVTCPFTEGPR